MRNWHLAPVWHPAVMTLRHAYDAGGGPGAMDGGGDPGDAAGDDAGDGGDPGDGGDQPSSDDDPARHATDGGDEDEDGDDFDRAEFTDLERDPRVAKLLKRVDKYRRRDQRQTPLVRAARALGIKDGSQLRELLEAGARGRAISDHQRERSAPPPDPRNQPLPDNLELEADAFDDLRQAGWDLNDPLNRALTGRMRQQAEAHHATRMTVHKLINIVRALDGEIQTMRSGAQQERQQKDGADWRSEIDGASKAFQSQALRETFAEAVYGRVARLKARGERVDRKAVVASVLRDMRGTGQITRSQEANANATRQRIAERNRTAPRPAALGAGGAPGNPQTDRMNERVSDVSRRIVGRGYVGRR